MLTTYRQIVSLLDKTGNRILHCVSRYLWCDGPRHLGKEAEHSLRESLVRDVMLQQQHLLLCVLLPCSAQTAHKVTLTKRGGGETISLSAQTCFLYNIITCHARELWHEQQNLASRYAITHSRTSKPQILDSLRRFQLTFGYLECLGQPSMATMIRCPASVDA